MANTNAPFGARPYKGLGAGANFEIQKIKAGIDDADTTKIYKGDFVKKLNTGYLAQWTATTAVSQLAGIFWGCQYLSTAIGRRVYSPYWPASLSGVTGIEWYVITDINTVFEIQNGGADAALAADIGDSADFVIAAGNTNTGTSGSYLNTARKGAAAVGNFRIMGLGLATDNAWADAYPILRVTIGKSQRFSEANSI